jgi:hypothetical protein
MLRVVSHPWSGIIEIESDGDIQKIDLYSSASGEKIIKIEEKTVAPYLNIDIA